MEVTEKEIMELIGKGEIYRQAAALHVQLAEVVKVLTEVRIFVLNLTYINLLF